MRFKPFDFPEREPLMAGVSPRPRSDAGGEVISLNDPEAIAFLRGGMGSASGAAVNIQTAMKVAVVWRCLHLIAGVTGNLPIDLYRRVSERERQPAIGHPVRTVLTQRPNGWQTPAEFRKMLTAHAVMKGAGFGIKITSRGRLMEIWPVSDPDRMQVHQRPDMTLGYRYTRQDGSQVELEGSDVLHLRGLTWDGVHGVGVLRHAREAMGLSLQVEQAGARLFRQGMIGGKVFTKPGVLGNEAFDRLKAQLNEQHAGAENAHKNLILEDGLTTAGELMTAEDMQFLGLREFQRSDAAIFMGVPPHMVGIVDKTTSWGSGIEQQSTGFVQYTADDWMVMWEQSIARDLLNQTPSRTGQPGPDADLYARINRNALLRGAMKDRWATYVQALQWGVYSPNEVRAFEDANPRDGGDEYYDPPNTPGDQGTDDVDDVPPPRPADA